MFGVFGLQSAFSMLKNTIPIETLVTSAKQGGYDFVALSDESLHGTLKLFKTCNAQGLKPVLGWRVTVTIDLVETSFLLLVKNSKGYQNLLQLQIDKINEKTLTIDHLARRQEGLIFISDTAMSVIDQAILEDDMNEAYRYANQFGSLFDTFLIGLGLETFDAEMKVAPGLLQISEKTGCKLVPVHRTSYIGNSQKDVYKALLQISGLDLKEIDEPDRSFMDRHQIETMYQDYPYVFKTASELVSGIDFNLELPEFDMPQFKLDQGVTSKDYLHSLATVGLSKRLRSTNDANHGLYRERLAYELKMIHRMGYDNYFLIVYDFVRHAKQSGILVGPGRGSAAGSLVAYATGITDVDPIRFDLLFERFLNPERISMPDIDMDFPDDKRDEVIRYVAKTYGENHIASIVTFGTFAKRSSIRDIAKVMGISSDRITGLVERILKNQIETSDREMQSLVSAANAIEGLPRQTGTHAAGIILAKQDLLKWLPLQEGPFPFYQSQFEASDLESLGLLKIDFLGIRNLSVIDQVVKTLHAQGTSIDLKHIPYDDPKTYDLLSKAETSGLFQLESGGMRASLVKLKPSSFEDIIAILALYRPGPMEHIDTYVRRKNGEPYHDIHPVLTPILKNTYGIIVYQEQIMKIASEFAGYSLAEADILRRGISKKDVDILEEERKRFIHKSLSKNRLAAEAKIIYDYIVKFANYGFNRSHSVAYAMVAYQMAYLKANYFGVFMTVLMTSVIGNESLTREYVQEVKKHGIRILPPDIHRSGEHYVYDKDSITLPLSAIRSISRNTVAKILDIRKEGPFGDYQQCKTRLKGAINDKQLDMLIKSGAFDPFGETRRTMLENKQIGQAGYEQYIQDFELRTYEEYSFADLAAMELESLGFSCLFNPMTAYAKERKEMGLMT
ncbi:MAG: DNA polymerase III subunit alpha, partial [Acholeplasmataceae bacterium]|nr:DNA polymerase III subunit alpha [Acholeplasmataceae bacterium]